MEQILVTGLAAGAFLYLAKLGSFYLLLFSFPSVRKWIHKTPIALFSLDLLGGYIAGHFLIGSNIGMIAMITFGTISMLVIFSLLFYQRVVKPKWKGKTWDSLISSQSAQSSHSWL